MGKRGPAPRPTNLKVLHGVQPCRINQHEPRPAVGEVEPSESISAEARAVWDLLATDLEAKGVLTAWDVNAFEVYCEAVVQFREATVLARVEGSVVRGAMGGAVKNPRLQVAKDAAEIMARYGARFGLTPSDRSQLSMTEAPSGKGADRLLS